MSKRVRNKFKYNHKAYLCWCPHCGYLEDWAEKQGWPSMNKDEMRRLHLKQRVHQKNLKSVRYGRPNYQQTKPLNEWKAPFMKK